ncbi:mechanosensitive ion channel domain-containing protein [Seongchinamella unica]|nr:mechanosensitive ion channel domain-containing protein [Seongchinamella unica]
MKDYPVPPSIVALLCLLGLLLAHPALAVTLADIENQRNAVSNDTTLDDESRAQLDEQLDRAQSQLQAAAEFRSRTANLKAEIEGAPGQAARFEEQLRQAKASDEDYSDLVTDDSSVAEVESQITLETAQLRALTERRNELIQAVDELPQLRAETRQRLTTVQNIINSESEAQAPASSSSDLNTAWVLSQARLKAAEAEKQYLETRITGEPAITQVNAAERAWLGQAVSEAEARLEALSRGLESARASATREQLQVTAELQQKLQSQDPKLQQFAEKNRQLARQLQDTANLSDRARREGHLTTEQLESIRQDSQLMHRRLEVAGRKEILGQVMITRLDSLPETRTIKQEIERRNALIADTSMAQIDVEEDFRALNEGSVYIERLIADLDQRNDDTASLVRQLVQQRLDLLEKNLNSLGSLLRLLLDNNDRAGELIAASEEFHRFLLGNLLWIRNFNHLDLVELGRQLGMLASPGNWLQLPAQLASGYNEADWSASILVLALLLFIGRRLLMPVYDSLITRPMLLSTATLWNILAALGLSLFLVLPWPVCLYLLGHFLQQAENGNQFSQSLAPALMFTSRILYLLLLTRMIANRKGVGRRYLKWDGRRLDCLREELNWVGPVMCSAILLDIFAYELDPFTSGGPLGAISTAAAAVTVSIFFIRLLRRGMAGESKVVRFSLRLGVFIAAVTLILQAMGLMYAADIYMAALARSIAWIIIIKTTGDVMERWLLILRARMEREARESMKAQPEEPAESAQEAALDVMSLSEAHTKLLNMARIVATLTVLWWIWSPSLPALNLLQSITLWTVSTSTGTLRDITLFDLCYSALVLIVTALLTRHLPSLSEVFMREWFNMSAGARYASSILMQYLVIAIGGSIFLTSIGWEWSKVQWLVAAMGVGIGFGLQEIVANFISGIIILFERPVRVGDIISAGGAEGVVKKINPRATIIETFDRKEHLIPNKELITGQVVNWTLSDAAVRVIIPVGIAYGSDVREALALILEAAGEVANVLPDPEPRATFEDFGDNSLILWLRCYVSEDRIGTWTELRTRINDKFNDAGIVISFPQRDVHLDTLEPLQLEIRNLDQIRGD